ncbi:MAG: hypothetical protein JO261_06290 [Alphaproteobacteria bacterium]|nr:hypothetical protein [Alphaproteobacteria bacterium]MBV9693293.1 hypothetical protein [Alphaproteobacteria bacterium]
MTADILQGAAPNRPASFAPSHRWDRNFFLTNVLLIWFGILAGFVPEIVAHIKSNAPPYPIILHVHAAAFVGWLILLTAQVTLIRRGRHARHRQLGIFGMALAAAMVVIGPATAIVMQRYHWGTADSDPAFLSVQFTDITIFAGLAAAAFYLRGDPSAHKRLILLATLHISNAGTARFIGADLNHAFGGGLPGFLASMYPADVLMLALGGYDLITRRRLHPVYLPALAWVAFWQAVAAYLDVAPWWKTLAIHLIGH